MQPGRLLSTLRRMWLDTASSMPSRTRCGTASQPRSCSSAPAATAIGGSATSAQMAAATTSTQPLVSSMYLCRTAGPGWWTGAGDTTCLSCRRCGARLRWSSVRQRFCTASRGAYFTWRTPAVYSQVREKERGRRRRRRRRKEEKKKRKRRKRKKVSFFLVWEQPGLGL